MFWLKKPVVLKDGLHDGELEPEELVEINILHVQARRTRRAGDLPGSLIFEHHCQEAIRRSGRFIVYDAHQDGWREYRGKLR